MRRFMRVWFTWKYWDFTRVPSRDFVIWYCGPLRIMVPRR